MKKIPFVDGTKTQEAYVTVNEQNYQVTPAVWQGTVPLSAQNLNKMQDNIEEAINIQRASVTIESTVNASTNYTIPLNYQVGNDSLEVYYCSTKLQKRNRLQRNRQHWRSVQCNTIYGQHRRFGHVWRGRFRGFLGNSRICGKGGVQCYLKIY